MATPAQLAEKARHAFYVRRDRLSLTAMYAEDALDELGQLKGVAMKRAWHYLHQWMPDQANLTQRIEKYAAVPALLNFERAAMELQAMVQDDFKEYLLNEGTQPDLAERVAKMFTFGALLHESDADEYQPPA